MPIITKILRYFVSIYQVIINEQENIFLIHVPIMVNHKS